MEWTRPSLAVPVSSPARPLAGRADRRSFSEFRKAVVERLEPAAGLRRGRPIDHAIPRIRRPRKDADTPAFRPRGPIAALPGAGGRKLCGSAPRVCGRAR